MIRKSTAFHAGLAAGTTLPERSVAVADGRAIIGPFLDARKAGRIGCDHGPSGEWGNSRSGSAESWAWGGGWDRPGSGGTGGSWQRWRWRVTGNLAELLSCQYVSGDPACRCPYHNGLIRVAGFGLCAPSSLPV